MSEAIVVALISGGATILAAIITAIGLWLQSRHAARDSHRPLTAVAETPAPLAPVASHAPFVQGAEANGSSNEDSSKPAPKNSFWPTLLFLLGTILVGVALVPVSLYAARHFFPSSPATSPEDPIEQVRRNVTPRVRKSAEPSQERRPAGAKPRYLYEFYLEGPPEVLAQIAKVTYQLGPLFDPPVQTSSDPAEGFKIAYHAWGSVEHMAILLTLRDGEQVELTFNPYRALGGR